MERGGGGGGGSWGAGGSTCRQFSNSTCALGG